MVTDGRIHDIDKDDMDRWCEYIFYRGLHRTAYARISRGSVTDTELQVGQFAIPSYAGPTRGEEEMSEDDRYLRGWKEDLPKEHVRLFYNSTTTVVRSRSLSVCYSLVGPSAPSSGSLMHIMVMKTLVVCGVTITTSLTRCVPGVLQEARAHYVSLFPSVATIL
jgi:hypothetical protein